MAWIISQFQGMLPCDIYFACKDLVPSLISDFIVLAFFVYFWFSLRPYFMRGVRELTYLEIILHFLLMLLLGGLVFILLEVFKSGSELFCST